MKPGDLAQHHGLILALWQDKATDLDIAIEIEATRGVEVSRFGIWKYRKRHGLMPSWPRQVPTHRALTPVQHVRLLRQYHEQDILWHRLMAYWGISKPTLWAYLWIYDAPPAAASIRRRPKKVMQLQRAA